MGGKNSSIVTINGWLLIAVSVLAVFQKARVHATDEKIVALLTLVLCVSVAIGLLLRRNWGRWMALGISLITWTCGSIAVFLAFGYGVLELLGSSRDMFGRERSSGDTFLLFMMMLIFFAILAVVIWLNFRLFEHLNSEAGREEFDAPEHEKHPVAKSTAVYVAWLALGAIIVEPGLVGAGRSSPADYAEELEQLRRMHEERARPSPSERDDAGASKREARQRQQQADRNAALVAQRDAAVAEEQAALVAQRDAALASARAEQAAAESMRRKLAENEARERQRAASSARVNAQEEYRRKLRELFERRVRDRSYTDAQFEADKERLTREFARANAYPQDASQEIRSGEKPSSVILKCRDSSGSISFTQGYCPAGTTLVESPPAD